MKYTKSYKALTPSQAYDKSIQDIVEYLGVERFRSTVQAFRADAPCGMSFDQFAHWCSFFGLQGFPVRAFYDWIFPHGDAPAVNTWDYKLHWHEIDNEWLRENHPKGYDDSETAQ